MAEVALWWIRRDLRLHDAPALHAALRSAAAVVPVFILDPTLARAPGAAIRRRFLIGGLRALDAALHARGGCLVVREGSPAEVLEALMAETGASAIFAERDLTPYARRRDAFVARSLPLRLVGHPTIHPPESLVRADGGAYRVFGAFRRVWEAFPVPAPLPPPERPLATPIGLFSLLHVEGWEARMIAQEEEFPPGEAEALRRLRAFTEGPEAPIYRYARERDRLDREGTARLSPYFRFGMLSPRTAAAAAIAAMANAPDAEGQRSAQVWLRELIWRDFFYVLFAHEPALRRRSLFPFGERIPWRADPEGFAAWAEGRTGYPLVDAGMRQLRATGWMPNRVRMVAAAFLAKHLLIDWRWGERWFMAHLLDGDPAINGGNWQWAAGVGVDTAPYVRIFQPAAQSRRSDPHGAYIRRWVPELADVPDEYVHAPWEMPPEIQRAAGCRIGVDYPAPWVPERAAAQARVIFQEARRR
jgi:deoxyribodipyrimidine photo-lyase